jgi:hypothetical protein
MSHTEDAIRILQDVVVDLSAVQNQLNPLIDKLHSEIPNKLATAGESFRDRHEGGTDTIADHLLQAQVWCSRVTEEVGRSINRLLG